MELINDEQALLSASIRGYDVPVYDDGFGPLWILRESMGVRGIARARTYQDAFEICEDEFYPEADETMDEIIAWCGFKVEHKAVILDHGVERYAEYPDDYPNGKLGYEFVRRETIETPDADAWMENPYFQEQYGIRPSGPNKRDKIGHGIYQRDLNWDSLDRLTPEMASDLGIKVVVEDWSNLA